jgi:V8-like Glu-specific endopeptidase
VVVHAQAAPGANVVASAAAKAVGAAGGNVSNGVPLTSQTKQWTASQRAAAKAMPLLRATARAATSKAAPVPTGPPGAVRGAGPDNAPPIAAAAAPAASGASAAGIEPLAFAYPTPFDRYREYDTSTYPNSTVGKVFFDQNGKSYVCSGAVIAEHAIWLAGHCVSDGHGHFSTNLTFVPQYDTGFAPEGSFDCPELWTKGGWLNNHNFKYDQGVAVCNDNEFGQTPRAAVGRLGFQWNQKKPLHYNALGYPQAAPFDGSTMQHCQSSFGHRDTKLGTTGPNPIAIGCDMTGGASGGPWITKYVPGSPGAQNYLNGHNDYKYTSPSQPLEMYSPYFDTAARSLLCKATEIC